MTWSMLFVLFVIVVMMICLIKEIYCPEFVVFVTLVIFLVSGILSPEEAVRGFSNEAILTVALLFIIGGSIQKSGVFYRLFLKFLSSPRNIKATMLRLLFPIAGISSFLNNTPIVVAFTPLLQKWCIENQISPSKFLIPLSYATILGGTITILGTSTNLVVHGMMLNYNLPGFSLFQLAIVGIPITIVGITYLVLIGYHLLPNYKSNEDLEHLENRRSYSFPLSKWKEWMALFILIAIILFVSFNVVSIFKASLIGVILLLFFKIISPLEISKYIHINILFLIACSFGVGLALINSGLANWIAQGVSLLAQPFGMIVVISAIYFLTNLFTEIMTNNAAAAMMIPIAIEVSHQVEINATALAVTVAIAASAGFSTPIGYQTHMIVYGPGGYKFKDFLKVGIPLNIITMIITVVIVYFAFI